MSKEELEEKIALLAEQQGNQSSAALAGLLKDVIQYVDDSIPTPEPPEPTGTDLITISLKMRYNIKVDDPIPDSAFSYQGADTLLDALMALRSTQKPVLFTVVTDENTDSQYGCVQSAVFDEQSYPGGTGYALTFSVGYRDSDSARCWRITLDKIPDDETGEFSDEWNCSLAYVEEL